MMSAGIAALSIPSNDSINVTLGLSMMALPGHWMT